MEKKPAVPIGVHTIGKYPIGEIIKFSIGKPNVS